MLTSDIYVINRAGLWQLPFFKIAAALKANIDHIATIRWETLLTFLKSRHSLH